MTTAWPQILAASLLTAACSSGTVRRADTLAAASCAGPQLGVGRFAEGPPRVHRAPVSVRAGQLLRLHGRFFLADCYDMGQPGHPPVLAVVNMVFVAENGRRTTLAAAHPAGGLGRFSIKVRVPDRARPGPAKIVAAPARALPLLVTRS